MNERERITLRSEDLPIRGLRELVALLNDAAAAGGGADFFVIGALARSLLLEGVHQAPVQRVTRDVDVAIALSGWEAYETVISALEDEQGFERAGRPHRLVHPTLSPLDLIPFGGLENPPGAIEWDEGNRRMSTLGMREAHAAAVNIWLDGELPVKVASLEGQALLKLIAWRDRPRERKRDAEDFCLLVDTYYDLKTERVRQSHMDLFGKEDSHIAIKGRMYGREVALLAAAASEVRTAVLALLEEETADPYASDFINAMASAQCFRRRADRYAALEGFLRGFRERAGP